MSTEWGSCYFCSASVPREQLRRQHGACAEHAVNHIEPTGEPDDRSTWTGEGSKEAPGYNPDRALLAMPCRWPKGSEPDPKTLSPFVLQILYDEAEAGDAACSAYLNKHFGRKESVA
jgi:hypothetical protein